MSLLNGFGTILMYSPKDKLIITALSNLNAYGYVYQDIAMKILHLLHGKKVVLARERKPVSVSQELLKRYVGIYKLSSTNNAYTNYHQNLEVRLDGNELIGEIEDKYAVNLYPESETRFFGLVPDVQIEFVSSKKQLVWRQDEENYSGTLI